MVILLIEKHDAGWNKMIARAAFTLFNGVNEVTKIVLSSIMRCKMINLILFRHFLELSCVIWTDRNVCQQLLSLFQDLKSNSYAKFAINNASFVHS